MTAGVALAVLDSFPAAEIYTVEPKGFDDYKRSLAAGSRQRNERMAGSICDALLMPEPGEVTFEINKDRLAGGIAVSDHDVREAVAYAFHEMKLVWSLRAPRALQRSYLAHSMPRAAMSRFCFRAAMSIRIFLRR